jgi:hypothetical protein
VPGTSLTRGYDSLGTTTRDVVRRKGGATDVVSLAKRLVELKAKGKLKKKVKVKGKFSVSVK